jgi:acyl transferase domain-containing protein
VVLEEAPSPTLPRYRRWAGEGAPALLVLSAKTASALETLTANLVRHLEAYPDLSLADVAFTLQTGRRPLEVRRAVVARDLADAAAALASGDPHRVWTAQPEPGFRPVAFLFPGQGAQHVRMASDLYERWPVFRQEMDRCSEVLLPHLDLREALLTDRLEQTALAQPALFAVEWSLARLWMDRGVEPEAMLGHSVGEFVAACLAGVFSLEDALTLVAARGRLVQEMPPGVMSPSPCPKTS